MSYKLSREETETHVYWDAQNKVAHLFTCDPVYVRKLDKLCKESPDTYKLERTEQHDDYVGKFYTFPSKLVSFRSPSTRTMTDEQRAAISERMSNARMKKKSARG